jgi:hypothetical protein
MKKKFILTQSREATCDTVGKHNVPAWVNNTRMTKKGLRSTNEDAFSSKTHLAAAQT